MYMIYIIKLYYYFIIFYYTDSLTIICEIGKRVKPLALDPTGHLL